MNNTLKHRLNRTLITTAAVAALAAGNAQAADDIHNNGWKTDAGVISGVAVGAVAGGPVGALAGALIGGWVGTKVETADEVSIALAESEATTQQLEYQVAALQDDLFRYRELAAGLASDSLQFEVLFYTDQSAITDATRNRISRLAAFIGSREDLNVSLAGYADPRGSDTHNLTLSEARVQAVATLLIDSGVAPEQIRTTAYGASLSAATPGDIDGYAFERRVSIELIPDAATIELASAQ